MTDELLHGSTPVCSIRERFEALCASLRRNDPETTEVVLTPYYYPVGFGWGRRLGDALEGNTHVSSMDLMLYNVLAADEGMDSAARLLHFISESLSMRKIHLVGVRDPSRPEVVAALLRLTLLAIAENSHIEELSLINHDSIGPPPPDAIALLLRTTQSLKTLSIKLDDFDGVESREVVAEAFGANRTLECLTLREFYFGAHTVESILLHLGSNPGLRELKLFCRRSLSVAHLRAMNHFLRSTISLEQLHLCDYEVNKERMEDFVEGWQSSRSLVKLTFLRCRFDLAATELFVRCLPKLVYLRELHMVSMFWRLHPRSFSFIDAIRQNGSLRVVEIEANYNFLIRSFCKRNEAIPTLVTNPRPDAMDISLLPKLFVAAKQARRTAPNSILLGLLFADEAIGPRQDRNKPPLQGPSAQESVAVLFADEAIGLRQDRNKQPLQAPSAQASGAVGREAVRTHSFCCCFF